METLNEIWAGIVWFFSSTQTNGLATALCAMLTLVASWKYVPELVSDYWPHSAVRRGVGLVRAVLNLSLITILTLTSAGIVMLMHQP